MIKIYARKTSTTKITITYKLEVFQNEKISFGLLQTFIFMNIIYKFPKLNALSLKVHNKYIFVC